MHGQRGYSLYELGLGACFFVLMLMVTGRQVEGIMAEAEARKEQARQIQHTAPAAAKAAEVTEPARRKLSADEARLVMQAAGIDASNMNLDDVYIVDGPAPESHSTQEPGTLLVR